MRISRLIPGVVFATLPLMAQEPSAPAAGPDELRKSVREWIETMREIQKEEDSWEKDQEVLKGYKEGLEKEIEDLKEQIERASSTPRRALSRGRRQEAEGGGPTSDRSHRQPAESEAFEGSQRNPRTPPEERRKNEQDDGKGNGEPHGGAAGRARGA